MQAAIDRVIRNLLPKPMSAFHGEDRPEMTAVGAEALADRLLQNFKERLAHNASQPH